jgi:hypothetical protein
VSSKRQLFAAQGKMPGGADQCTARARHHFEPWSTKWIEGDAGAQRANALVLDDSSIGLRCLESEVFGAEIRVQQAVFLSIQDHAVGLNENRKICALNPGSSADLVGEPHKEEEQTKRTQYTRQQEQTCEYPKYRGVDRPR